MPNVKTALQSRTIWANLVGLAAFALPFLGINSAGLDTAPIVDTIMQMVVGGSFLASTTFRLLATKRIG